MVNKIETCLQACADWGLIPTAFRQCMTWEEQVLWLFKFLQQTVIPALNDVIDENNELATAFEALKVYVDDYFNNLDIQTEVDNKLDEMADSGQLADIIAAYLQLKGILAFNTVEDIEDATNLVNGSFVKTYGYKRLGDGVSDLYKVRGVLTTDVIDGYNIVAIDAAPTLIAERLPYSGSLVIKMIATDNLEDYLALNGKKTIILPKGIDYEFSEPLYLNSDTTIDLNGSKLLFTDISEIGIFTYKADDTFTGYSGHSNITVKNGKIYGGGIAMMHNKNVLFENVEFEQSNSRHTMQIAGCYNVAVKACVFKGTLPVNDTGSECINIDPCTYGAQPFIPEESPMFDETPNKHIEICGNEFKDATNASLRYTNAIGTHGHNGSGATTAEDVYIANNNFGNPYYSAINVADYINTVIENNTCETSKYFIIKRGWMKHIKVHNNTANTLTKAFFGNSGASLKTEDLSIVGNDIVATEPNASTDAVLVLVSVQGANIANNTIKFQNHCVYACDKESWDGGTYDSTYRAQNITVANNSFIKTTVQDSAWNNRIKNTDNIKYIGNNFTHLAGGLESTYSEFLFQETNTGVVVQNNMTDSPCHFLPSDKLAIIGSGFAGNNALYPVAALGNAASRTGTFDVSVANFSELLLTCGTSADTQTVSIKPYYTNEKLDNRTWKVPQVKSDGTFGYATFTVSTDTSWSYSGSLALRRIVAKD